MDFSLQEPAKQAFDLIAKFGLALVLFAAFWLAAKLTRKLLRRMGQRMDAGKQHVLGLLGQIVFATLLVIGAITALGTVGVNVTALVASLGLAGFAVGFALKDALSNLLAGIMILLYRPFQPGDHISAAGHNGKVSKIDFRYTTLQHENKTILLPNATLFTNSITVHNDRENAST
ncbi:MAG: mechanosensitive ion channel [Gammaproteobacteria bacterium]|nr:MAG: mechanosensitive ion channel [Gammaproteobacteria bacterium]